MPSPAVSDAVQAALIRLLSNYSAFVDEATFTVVLKEWNQAADRHEFVTPELIGAALTHYLYRETTRDRMPTVGQFLDTCRQTKIVSDRKAAGVHILPAPVTRDIGASNFERIREMVKLATAKGKALHHFHARLVHLAEVTGHKLPTVNGLTDRGSEWVRTEYGRAREHFHANGGLDGFEPNQPPPPESADPTIGKPLSEIAPRWTMEQERALLAKWPHLQKASRRPEPKRTAYASIPPQES